MMAYLIQVADAASMWVLFWCAGATLLARHEVRSWRSLLVSLGLIFALVFSFCGALVLTWHYTDPMWWASGMRIAIAMTAVGMYEYQFGIARQLRMLRDWLIGARMDNGEPTS